MVKTITQINPDGEDAHEIALRHAKKILEESCSSFVLISCTTPTKDGKMSVKMSFEGEEELAAFLVENAKQVFDANLTYQESKESIDGI